MTQTANGDARTDHRIIVIVPHEPGALTLVTATLGEAGVNIETIDGRNAGALGVITLRTNDDDAALHALLEADLRAVTSDAIVFHLPDRPGALAEVAQRFSAEQINVRTIHIVHRQGGEAIVAVTTEDDRRARELLDPESLL